MTVKLTQQAPNFTIVEIDGTWLYFSYETVVAFDTPTSGLVILENIWSVTTGKHLDSINRDKKFRVPHDEFERLLDKHVDIANGAE